MKKALFAALAATAALWGDTLSIEHIVVSDRMSDEGYLNERNGSVERFGAKSIATLSSQAKMNPFHITQYSPSVNFTPVDAAGSNEPSYHDPIRIRGKSQSGPGGVYMIDSMPISSNPGGGKQMLDMENVSGIDLLKGYITPERNLGFSSLIGKVDMQVLRPKNQIGAALSQAFGSDGFKSSFVRLDSGELGDVRLFGSFSYLGSDLTKGAGDLQRTNGNIGLSYTPNGSFDATLYLLSNRDAHHNYASLTYAEVRDLGRYADKSFAATKPLSDNDVNYYDWNRQKFDATALISTLRWHLTPDDLVTLKPYYKQDKGEYWNAQSDANASKNRVINWKIDHDLYGVVAEYAHSFGDALSASAGYWYHKQLPPGPPTDRRKYKVVGGELVFDGYAALADTGYHVLQAPFVQAKGELGAFSYALGLQYQRFELASLKSYTFGTNAKTSTDYDQAIREGVLDSASSVEAKTFHTWIPSLYAAYAPDEANTLYLSYARTYGFDVNLFPTYLSNRANFMAKNVTLQQLWDKLNLELSDNIDLGYKTYAGDVLINPLLFVSFVQNKQANVYDPQYKVNYPANIGDALGYGAELSASGPLGRSLQFMASLSYNKFAFSQDFKSAPTTTVETKGKQVPDAPEYLFKSALSYTLGDWVFTPSVRYSSKRYGDLQNTQRIDAYTLFDLDIAYDLGALLGAKEATLRLSATNLTNERYIATIISADNVLATTGTSSTYETGAPLQVFGSLGLVF